MNSFIQKIFCPNVFHITRFFRLLEVKGRNIIERRKQAFLKIKILMVIASANIANNKTANGFFPGP